LTEVFDRTLENGATIREGASFGAHRRNRAGIGVLGGGARPNAASRAAVGWCAGSSSTFVAIPRRAPTRWAAPRGSRRLARTFTLGTERAHFARDPRRDLRVRRQLRPYGLRRFEGRDDVADRRSVARPRGTTTQEILLPVQSATSVPIGSPPALVRERSRRRSDRRRRRSRYLRAGSRITASARPATRSPTMKRRSRSPRPCSRPPSASVPSSSGRARRSTRPSKTGVETLSVSSGAVVLAHAPERNTGDVVAHGSTEPRRSQEGDRK